MNNMNSSGRSAMNPSANRTMNQSANRTMNRRQLMDHINQVSFAVNEATLYLDTHPCDTEALSYFREMSARRNRALKEYAEAYGPLTVDTASDSCTEHWNWINEPWPWQEGVC